MVIPVHLIDDSDANWWKGQNQRGEGLFPANFVTTDLEAGATGAEETSSEQVAPIEQPPAPEISEDVLERLLGLLHDADPGATANVGSEERELRALEARAAAMGPLVDQELERVDRSHARLTQLSADLVDALNLYHTLMREQAPLPPVQHQYMQYPPPGQMYGYAPPPQHFHPPQYYQPGPHSLVQSMGPAPPPPQQDPPPAAYTHG